MGFWPLGPGTWGSALAAVLFPGLAQLGLPLYGLTVAAITLLGVWASTRSEAFFGRSDDGRIVIDEVAGQWLALLPLVVLDRGALGGSLTAAAVVTGFVLFRCFDIWKPGPVRWAERRFGGGVGVMADDLVAGGLAAAVLTPALWVLLDASGGTP